MGARVEGLPRREGHGSPHFFVCDFNDVLQAQGGPLGATLPRGSDCFSPANLEGT